MRVSFLTIGCKVNQCESEALASRFQEEGWEVVTGEEADLFVVNTCTVTGEAERKCRQQIRRIARKNPQAQIIAMGCYSQVAPEELELPGVTQIVGTDGRSEILALAKDPSRGHKIGKLEPGLAFEDLGIGTLERTRAHLKIQDGCGGHCTYCRVRIARGPIRSLPANRVLALARELVALGYREIVLCGINLGTWGQDLEGKPELSGLLAELAAVPDLARIRLGSLEPHDLTEKLLAVMEEHPQIVRHLHLPLQSGSGKILKLMGRNYTPDEFTAKVARLRESFPTIGLSADILVGFPGEGDAEFQESYDFIKSQGLTKLHIFPYSPRPGTPALKLPNPVSKAVVQARAQKLASLGQELALSFHRSFLGTEVEIILETEQEGLWEGVSGEYVRVQAEGVGVAGEIRKVSVTAYDREGLFGTLC